MGFRFCVGYALKEGKPRCSWFQRSIPRRLRWKRGKYFAVYGTRGGEHAAAARTCGRGSIRAIVGSFPGDAASIRDGGARGGDGRDGVDSGRERHGKRSASAGNS